MKLRLVQYEKTDKKTGEVRQVKFLVRLSADEEKSLVKTPTGETFIRTEYEKKEYYFPATIIEVGA